MSMEEMKQRGLLPERKQSPANSPRTQGKTLEKETPPRYNKHVGNLACQSKEGTATVSHTVKGSLQDENGTWVVRARVFDASTGKVRQRSKSTGMKVRKNTKRQAERMMRDIVAAWEKEANQPVKTPRKNVPFSEYVREWLNNKELSVRPNTAKSYRDYANVHILPALGDYPVSAITWRTLQQFCDKMLVNHSKNSVKKFFVVIRGALDDAVRDGAISSNPESLVRWPVKSERTQTARALSNDEVRRLLDAAEQTGEPIRSAVTLALFYGLRRSEVCGLRWTDIDFNKGTMHIQYTVTENGTVLLDDDHTKTKKSNRTLALVEQTIPYLKQLRAEQVRAGIIIDKVVAWMDGKRLRPDGITTMFRTLLRRSGIEKARYHDLRHTAATILANAGVPPKQLQIFLGHNDIKVTLGIYTHLADNAAFETSNQMGKAMSAIASEEMCSDFCSESGSSKIRAM